ncbi:hypothetical protein K474DRAFT_1668559 [Panus rudis PR-1116 ss-1]|nr:hypothetical protein K474DRAFT_1668559 [Panus rudis PR-1116 ss-1]
MQTSRSKQDTYAQNERDTMPILESEYAGETRRKADRRRLPTARYILSSPTTGTIMIPHACIGTFTGIVHVS